MDIQLVETFLHMAINIKWVPHNISIPAYYQNFSMTPFLPSNTISAFFENQNKRKIQPVYITQINIK